MLEYPIVVETITERKELPQDFRVVFLIGRGSRLPNILDKITAAGPGITVPVVVSHRKPAEGEADVVGIAYAKKLGVPTSYWNLVQMQAADSRAAGKDNTADFRPSYMRTLGAFLSQENYRPHLIVMTGWDLILDENFLAFFKGIPVINVHPHYLPDVAEPQDKVIAPDGTQIPVLRGTEVWIKAIEDKLAWSGVTIHQVIPREYDVGPVVAREWVKIDAGDTAETLRGKLNAVEDKIVPETIFKIQKGEVTLS